MKVLVTCIFLTAIALGCKKQEPQSLFTTDKDIFKTKESIQFINQSENGINYFWDFGDGTTSDLKNPGHTYAEFGEFIVTLQVEGSKKTTPAEFNKKLLIQDSENLSIDPDVIFPNTNWVCDSITSIYKNCTSADIDYSTNNVNNSLKFYDNNTVLVLRGNIANVCEYQILNDSLIGFTEAGYYRTSVFEIVGNRLTLKANNTFPCQGTTQNGVQGEISIQHFYKQ